MQLKRIGDFYEAYGDDASALARTVGLRLSMRGKSTANPVAMSGFPYHQLDAYLGKLRAEGFTVDVVESA